MRQLTVILPVLVFAFLLSACNTAGGTTPSATTAGAALVGLMAEPASKNSRIYVTNTTGTGTVAYYAIGGGKANKIVQTGLGYPSGIAFAKNGNFYVTDYTSGAVFTYTKDGKQ